MFILTSTMLQLTTCICSILAHHFYSNRMIHFNVMAFMRVAPGSTFHCNFWSTFDPRYMNKKCSIQNDKPVAFQAHLIHLIGKEEKKSTSLQLSLKLAALCSYPSICLFHLFKLITKFQCMKNTTSNVPDYILYLLEHKTTLHIRWLPFTIFFRKITVQKCSTLCMTTRWPTFFRWHIRQKILIIYSGKYSNFLYILVTLS